MASVSFQADIGEESLEVFVTAHFDGEGDVETMTVAPLVEGRVQMDISGYLDSYTLKRLRIEAVAESIKQGEQARTDAAIERYETEQMWRKAA